MVVVKLRRKSGASGAEHIEMSGGQLESAVINELLRNPHVRNVVTSVALNAGTHREVDLTKRFVRARRDLDEPVVRRLRSKGGVLL